MADAFEHPETTEPTEDLPDGAPDTASEPADVAEPSAPEGAVPDALAGAAALAGEPPQSRRRRRRIALLAFLSIVALGLATFTAWYLIFRQPISEFPLPNLTTEAMPTYQFSMYGATRPTGIAVNSDGSRIYAAQSEPTAAVVVFDAHGQRVAQMDPPDPSSYHVFVYVALNPLTGEVYVSDRPAAAIYVYGADGTYKRTFDPPSSLAGWSPLGLNFDSAGRLFVTDAAVGRVYEFGPDGSLVRTIGADKQFSFPNSALDDSAARLYIADSNNGRLAVLGDDGSQLAVVRRGPGDGDLGMPRGIALDNQSRLFVVDATSQAVKVYRVAADDSGQPTFVGRFGTQGVGNGQFNFPNAVATDSRGRVYVADWANDRIQVWSY